MAKVSIIIPVYNAEKYLEECLESIMVQTLKDIEVICVNDGSTDKSGQILNEYAKKNSRIKVIHKENGGVVSARNVGYDVATGKYIGFVDSDDWVEPEMYEKLYEIAEREGVDLVTSGYFMEGNYTTLHLDTLEAGVYKKDKYNSLLDQMIYRSDKKETGLRASICCKLFKKEKFQVVREIIPKELTISEDKMCLIRFALECESAYVQKEAYYHYRMNNASVVHSENPKYLQAVNEVYQYIRTLYTHPRFTSEMRTQAEIYITELTIKGINTFLGFQNKNLLWIDPYWLDNLPSNSRIVLYGAGELGKKYRRHLESREDLRYIACVDPNFEKCSTEEFPVLPLEKLAELEYDYVVITIKNPAKAKEVKESLAKLVPMEKILWFEQPEIFWKYVEADGLL